ncbi:MAG: ParB N-terminal domain-containing protein [Candidatus Methanofastidiosa archaeon]|nr:ParB N-terminal domain-containing protein [Candidatus Methanofastidiosa archaeon]
MGVERWSKVRKPLQIMKVEMIPISDVSPHEEIIEEEITDFIKSLKSKGIFYRPILLDRKTLVVLDGHHRVEGLRRLGAKMVPGILLDYDGEDVELYTWYPVIWQPYDEVVSFIRSKARTEDVEVNEAMEMTDNDESVFCILPDIDGMTILVHGTEEVMEIIKDRFTIEFVDTLDFLEKLDGKNGALLYRRAPTKKEVIERALSGRLYPPKTTRHYLPFRYQDIRIKLSNLF